MSKRGQGGRGLSDTRGRGWWLALALICGVGCSPDNPLVADNSDSSAALDAPGPLCGEVTYQNFAADFFAEYCLRCHNAQLEGDLNRTDAPTGINFNTLAGVRAFQTRIRLRAGVQGDMPPRLLPVPRPSDVERQRLIDWIDCGAPADGG